MFIIKNENVSHKVGRKLGINFRLKDLYLLKHFNFFATYYDDLIHNNSISEERQQKFELLENVHRNMNKFHIEYYDGDYSLKNLDYVLCDWISTAELAKEDVAEHIENFINENNFNEFCVRYLVRKVNEYATQ